MKKLILGICFAASVAAAQISVTTTDTNYTTAVVATNVVAKTQSATVFIVDLRIPTNPAAYFAYAASTNGHAPLVWRKVTDASAAIQASGMTAQSISAALNVAPSVEVNSPRIR